VAIGAAVVVVLVAVAAIVVVSRGGSSEAVRLEPAADAGPDPFTQTVTATEVATLSEPVTASAAELTAAADTDDATGTPSVAGTTPGLYGGTRDERSCDAGKLADFLADNPDKAEAWAGVLDIEADQVPEYLAGLTPVVLTADTLVTNHGFSDGTATPRQSVLQAGSAVMVDAEGTPRVRCSCGNPLTPPAQRTLADATLEGEQWSGWSTDSVTVVTPGDPVETITLVDLSTGERFEQPVGSAIGATWIAVSGTTAADLGAPSGQIHTSPDGTDWSVALDTTTPLRGVAVSSDLAVVVGNDGRGGVVHTSADGATWSDAVSVIDPLVAVAHGDGTWVAVGDRSFAEEGGEGDGSAGAIYRSTDGTTWQRVATTSPYDNSSLTAQSGGILYQSMISVAYGDGLWVATARECAERMCQLVEFTSTDTTTWTRKVLDGALTNVVVGHDGTSWGFVGSEGDADAAGADSLGGPPPNVGVAGTSTDGTSWSFGPTEPDRVVLEGLSAGDGAWLAVHDTAMSQNPVPERDGVYRSEDLATWTELSTIEADLHGIAVFDRAFAAPTPVAAPTTTAAPAVDAEAAAGIRVLTRGLQFQDAAGMDTTMSLFAEPATSAIATITASVGAPERTVQAGDGTCVAESLVLRWGAIRLIVPGTSDDGSDWQVFVQGTADELPMPVTVAGQFTLGSSADEVTNYFPGVPKLSFAYEGIQYDNALLDPSGGEMDPGTRVGAENGTVNTISAPDYLEDVC
jgi:hypothetical protein